MRKQNNLARQINERTDEYFFGEEQKIKSELRDIQDQTKNLYDYLTNGLRNEMGWTKKWVEREYALLEENFTPEKISERIIGIYDFMRKPIQNQIIKYQEDKN